LEYFDTFYSPENVAGASPESRRKVAGASLTLNYYWKLEVEGKWDVLAIE
jgi:hypothetical protein